MVFLFKKHFTNICLFSIIVSSNEGGMEMIKRIVLELNENQHLQFKEWCVKNKKSMRGVLTNILTQFMKKQRNANEK